MIWRFVSTTFPKILREKLSPQEVSETGGKEFLLRNNSAAMSFYRNAQSDTTYHKLWEKSRLFNTVDEGLDLIISSNGYLMQAAVDDYRFHTGYPCSFVDMKWNALSEVTGLLVRRYPEHGLNIRLKEFLLLLEQSGQLNRMRSKWLDSIVIRNENECQADDTGFAKCIVAFILIASGAGLSLVLSGFEKIRFMWPRHNYGRNILTHY